MNKSWHYDLVVAGGGVAGVAAALEAARAGLRVALVEKTIITGGLATAGLVNAYLPLCDGCGRQVTFGIAEELLQLSLRYGPGNVPADWRQAGKGQCRSRYCSGFSPAAFVLALDEALTQAGVTLWFDTLICAAEVKGNRITGIEVENKSGRSLFTAPVFIDATGDADVAHYAGAECAETGNWLAIWGIEASLQAARKAVADNSAEPLLQFFRLGGDKVARDTPADIPPTRGTDTDRVIRGTDAEQVTRFILEGRRVLREHYRTGQTALGADGRNQLFPQALPSMAQFRTTRRIVGQTTLQAGQAGKAAPDSIGLAADWRTSGQVWEIPYGTLLPRKANGLLAAGRCIASEGDAWEVTRVIPIAALTGQVAGAAATLAMRGGTTPDALDPKDVQAVLRQKSIPYHLADL